MILKDSFFCVKDFCQTASGIDFIIELNSEHIIYQAHFPGNPITPGVCIIQIVKELVEEKLERKFLLKKVNQVKFLNIINPLENRELTFSVSISQEGDEACKIGAVVYHGEHQFAKLSMLFVNQLNSIEKL
jgi:3-hydroxyacyl-[acyl-carrier-protein] dehydratase